MIPQSAGSAVNGLHRKNEFVELIRTPQSSARVSISLDRLEAMRADTGCLPASKHSLELICGASCETAAQ